MCSGLYGHRGGGISEQEGLAEIFTDAGLDWTGAGCAMCVGMNGDVVAPGRRCASTTNRNFKGRMGCKEAEIFLGSPETVAASAIHGKLTDPRTEV